MKKLLRKLRERATCEAEDKEDELEINQMMDNVEYGRAIPKGNSGRSLKEKQVTICQEFNLTRPRVRKLRFIQKVEARPEPVRVEVHSSKTLKEIEEEKQRRRQRIKRELEKDYARVAQVELKSGVRARQKPKKKENGRGKDAENFNVGNFLSKGKKVDAKIHDRKLFGQLNRNTKAAVLKEAKVVEKMEERRKKKLRELETGLRDSGEFKKWKREEEKKEEEQRKQKVRQRKAEFEEGLERVKRKTEKMRENNQEKGRKMRKRREKEKGEKEKREEKEKKEREEKRKEEQKKRERGQNKKKQMIQEKGTISEAVREQKNLDRERVKQRKLGELAKKKKMIQEIREQTKSLRQMQKERKSREKIT